MKLVLPEDVALGASNGSFALCTRRSSEVFFKVQSGRMRQWSKAEAESFNYMGEKNFHCEDKQQ